AFNGYDAVVEHPVRPADYCLFSVLGGIVLLARSSGAKLPARWDTLSDTFSTLVRKIKSCSGFTASFQAKVVRLGRTKLLFARLGRDHLRRQPFFRELWRRVYPVE